MKVECENLGELEATSDLIRELIRDDVRRGEFMILMQDADEEAFVQIAGDYEEVGGKNDGCFDLEYRDGASSLLYHANRRATADEVEQALLSELRGDRSWRSRFEWETEKVGGCVRSCRRELSSCSFGAWVGTAGRSLALAHRR